jgi:hypothetical protein
MLLISVRVLIIGWNFLINIYTDVLHAYLYRKPKPDVRILAKLDHANPKIYQ